MTLSPWWAPHVYADRRPFLLARNRISAAFRAWFAARDFAAKKLLTAGEPRLFTFARVFRNRERTALHHPGFTMLEWYRANELYGVLIDDCAALLRAAADAAVTRCFAWRGCEADPFA